MSEWDFLHDMHDRGYSAEQILEASTCGYNLYEFDPENFGYSSDEWEVIENDSSEYVPQTNPELEAIFEDLVHVAEAHYSLTNRYLQIWGELGELYAEIEYGIQRHKPCTKGSDGKLGNDFIEVKTISPEKTKDEVRVKRAGNFNKLLIVKISEDFTFQAQLIARKNLAEGDGKYARASWNQELQK